MSTVKVKKKTEIEEKFTEKEKRFFLENMNDLYFREWIVDEQLHIQMYLNNKGKSCERVVRIKLTSFIRNYKYQEYQDIVNLNTKGYKKDTLIEESDIPKFTTLFSYLKFILGRWPTQEELAYAYLELFCYIDKEGYYHIKEEFLTRDKENRVKYQRSKDKEKPIFILFNAEQERFTYFQLQRRISKPYPSLLREDVELLRLTLKAIKENKTYLFFYKDTYFDLKVDADILCDDLRTGLTIPISVYNASKAGRENREEKIYNNSFRQIKVYDQRIYIETIRSK